MPHCSARVHPTASSSIFRLCATPAPRWPSACSEHCASCCRLPPFMRWCRRARRCDIAVSRRELQCSEIAAIEADVPARFQNAFSTETTYRLIARAKAGRGGDVVVAESLRGSAQMEQIKRELEWACGLRVQAGIL